VNASADDLLRILRRIDGRGYPAYKDIRGQYQFDDFRLIVDHVQGDPFAAPSRMRVQVPAAIAAFPEETRSSAIRAVALRDYLARAFSRACREFSGKAGSGKSGLFHVPAPGQEILERSSVLVGPDGVEARFTTGLPARGRRVLGREAARMLLDILPEIVNAALLYEAHDRQLLARHLDTAEDADCLRGQLTALGLVAFVADDAVLPRTSGVDERPLPGRHVVPFAAPESLRASVELPHAGTVTGMGIPRGVTLIVGGGYHGKSTLLAALERGVYNHLPGDGRELAVTDPTAVKIRAEDGRRVEGVDITPFIGHLPGGGDPAHFRSDNASGSTSQAANIMESLEVGAGLLLLDEDTSATNLMIRDARMQELVEKSGEPITPFLDRVRQLSEDRGVSTVLVLGGSGDYFDAADRIIRMDAFRPRDVTPEAKAIAARHPTGRHAESPGSWPDGLARRYPVASSLDPRKGRRDVNIKARALRSVLYGTEEIDLGQVAQLVDEGQVKAIGRAIELARREFMDHEDMRLCDVIDAVLGHIERHGLDGLDTRPFGDTVEFRPYELAAAINRLRTLRVRNA